MALAGKHSQAQVGIASTPLYTAVAANMVKASVVLSNVDTVQRTVDVTITDSSAVTTRHIIKAAPVPVGGALQLKGIILETGDVLNALTDSANMIEATVSVVELT